ncbi:MAG: hypothetical protein RLZZ15_4256 [Verrucomicrobiota bacterium]|jgi:hypothetical protein
MIPLVSCFDFPRMARPHSARHVAIALWSAVGALLFFAWPAPACAFPPAPFYTIYGIVRDQVGSTLNAQGADLILLRDSVEIARTRILSDVQGDLNYEFNMSIDASRASSRLYANKALPAQGVYSLVVVMNGENFYPIEVNGTLRAGNGGERVRLDLTLGADTNHDGLPDAWQEWVLYQAGRIPGTAGWDINLITKNGDFDGDGISNYAEYIAGTFAGDATERFELKIVGKSATTVTFEFFAITGKAYAIEESPDLKTWTTASFATSPGSATAQSFRAPAVGVQQAFVTVAEGNARFYRLTVR